MQGAGYCWYWYEGGGSRSERTGRYCWTSGGACSAAWTTGTLVHRPGVSEWKIADYVVGDKQAVIPGAMMSTTRGMVLTMTTTRTVETDDDDQTGRQRTVRLSVVLVLT
jgi:hypothetical protein